MEDLQLQKGIALVLIPRGRVHHIDGERADPDAAHAPRRRDADGSQIGIGLAEGHEIAGGGGE
jgi:hypothetical protein